MRNLFKDIRTVMEAGGAKAGTLELVSTSYEKALEHAKSKGIVDVMFNTNASLLTEKKSTSKLIKQRFFIC